MLCPTQPITSISEPRAKRLWRPSWFLSCLGKWQQTPASSRGLGPETVAAAGHGTQPAVPTPATAHGAGQTACPTGGVAVRGTRLPLSSRCLSWPHQTQDHGGHKPIFVLAINSKQERCDGRVGNEWVTHFFIPFTFGWRLQEEKGHLKPLSSHSGAISRGGY